MTTPLLPGRPVPTTDAAPCAGCGATVGSWRNRAPDTGRETCSECATTLPPPIEPPAQHLRNALQLLNSAELEIPSGRHLLTASEATGIRRRLTAAILQLEGKA